MEPLGSVGGVCCARDQDGHVRTTLFSKGVFGHAFELVALRGNVIPTFSRGMLFAFVLDNKDMQYSHSKRWKS